MAILLPITQDGRQEALHNGTTYTIKYRAREPWHSTLQAADHKGRVLVEKVNVTGKHSVAVLTNSCRGEVGLILFCMCCLWTILSFGRTRLWSNLLVFEEKCKNAANRTRQDCIDIRSAEFRRVKIVTTP